jgi:NADPH-dependent 2,4-dienoyl-CoA reductase/sulfur reductase-like enzyme
MKDQVLSGILDTDMSSIVEDYIMSSGIRLIKGRKIDMLEGNPDLQYAVSGVDKIAAEVAVIATGFKAGTKLAEESGIETEPGGIKTDRMLMTSCDDVFAAGNCIQCWSVIDGLILNSKLATSAYKQGIIAGMNASGKNMEYAGSAGTFVTVIGGLEIAGVGFNTVTAKERGFDPVTVRLKSKIKPDYFPDNTDISIKVISDRSSGRIIGAQAIGIK